jgi:hypothetical protein
MLDFEPLYNSLISGSVFYQVYAIREGGSVENKSTAFFAALSGNHFFAKHGVDFRML